MNDDAVMSVTPTPVESFREDVGELIKMCGLTQKGIAEKHLQFSTTKMSNMINSSSTEWPFFEQVIEICLAKIPDGPLPEAMREEWRHLDHWRARFAEERQSPRPAEAHAAEADPVVETDRDAPESEPVPSAESNPVPTGSSLVRRVLIGTTAAVGIAAVVWGVVLLRGVQEQKGGADGKPTGAASSSASTLVEAASEPWIEVTGTCVGADTQWRVKSSGFTPKGTYTVNVWFPDGTPYSLNGPGDRGTQGVANADGSLNTRWQCYAPDPEGTYTMTIRDEVTGETATARFFVDQPD